MVCLDDTLHQCKPDSGALHLLVEAFEQVENPVPVLRIDANTVVTNRANHFTPLEPSTNSNHRRGLIAHELDRVFDQILKYFLQAQAIAPVVGHVRLNLQFDATGLDFRAKFVDGTFDEIVQAAGLRWADDTTDAAEFEQTFQ